MHLIPQFISDNGLSEFVFDGLEKDIVIDFGAMRNILEKTHELRKLSIRNANEVNHESLRELIVMIGDLILFQTPKLTEIEFSGFGGSFEQGVKILEAIYQSQMQIEKLDISNNLKWTQIENFSDLLNGILAS